MIPFDHLTIWAKQHPWPEPQQVEQDLLLSRAICAIAQHPYLGNELVFRGGTALHRVHLPEALRYSEDLDYVRVTAGGIGPLTGALSDLGRELGFDVRTRVSQHPKVFWRTTAQDGGPLRLKIEVNTHERSPALPHIRLPYAVHSGWWSGQADVLTFNPAELVATKIRALYQRSKGRDLFDLWLALDHMALEPDEILVAAVPYLPDGLTAPLAIANLRSKLRDQTFRADLNPLVSENSARYTLDDAAELVIDRLLSRLNTNHHSTSAVHSDQSADRTLT